MVRLGICAMLLLAACSSGGSSGANSLPTLGWASFRHDNANSGLASGVIQDNQGRPTLVNDGLGGVTGSTPAIDTDGNVYLGTENGLLALDSNGVERWRFDRCDLSDGTSPCPSASCVDVGRISSSPAITTEGVVVVGSEGTEETGGFIFAVQDDDDSFTCLWKFSPSSQSADFSVRSSPILLVDISDRSLISAFVGTSEGKLQALNGDGTPKWHFPAGAETAGELASSPAIGSTGALYVHTPDGFLHALDSAGRSLWQFPAETARGAFGLPPSPAVSVTVYTVAADGLVVAVNPDGTLKWRFQADADIVNSPAFAGQIVEEPPDEEGNEENVFDTIVYVVDEEGTLYGIRDSDGTLLPIVDDDRNVIGEAKIELSVGSVRLSPVISGDLFAVVASDEGLVCARKFADTETIPDSPEWESGCMEVGDGSPILSSPVIDRQGTIYVTTNAGLYAIQ